MGVTKCRYILPGNENGLAEENGYGLTVSVDQISLNVNGLYF